MSSGRYRRRPQQIRRSASSGQSRPVRRRTVPLAMAALASIAATSSASAARVMTITPGPSAAGAAASEGLPYLSTDAPSYPTRQAVPSLPGGAVGAGPGQPGRIVGSSQSEVASELAANGIPLVALKAYRNAEQRLAAEDPGCGLSWSLLAAIGRVESNHGQFGGAELRQDGRSEPPIVGPVLNGQADFARIADTDHGRVDGDATFDRAVGPMQFIPSTWVLFARVDGDGDGRSDPYDIDDAALAAGLYLCAAGGDLRTENGMQAAVFSYNHSDEYVRLVLELKRAYELGLPASQLPAADHLPRVPLPPPPAGPLPPASVGTPPGVPDGTLGPTHTPTPTGTSTGTSTGTPTGTPTGTSSPTLTASPTPSPTTAPTSSSSSPSPSPSCSPTPTPTPTATDSTTATTSSTPTASSTSDSTVTPTTSPTPTSTSTSPTPTVPAC